MLVFSLKKEISKLPSVKAFNSDLIRWSHICLFKHNVSENSYRWSKFDMKWGRKSGDIKCWVFQSKPLEKHFLHLLYSQTQCQILSDLHLMPLIWCCDSRAPNHKNLYERVKEVISLLSREQPPPALGTEGSHGPWDEGPNSCQKH